MSKKRKKRNRNRTSHEAAPSSTEERQPSGEDAAMLPRGRLAFGEFMADRVNLLLLGYLALYAVFGVLTVGFYPSYSWPGGDEGTYYDAALHPVTLVGELFEGYPPMGLIDPYAPRIFVAPFSLVFVLFGFTMYGARLVIFAYGLILLLLTYLIGCRLMSRAWAFAAVVLLSLSPQFLIHTHAVRQEGMMSLTIALGVWLILRGGDRISNSTLFWLGAIGVSSMMVHRNGVFLAPIFLAAAITYDMQILAWKKLLWFVAGCAAGSVLFLLISFLPGLEKIREYGIMPVVYISHTKIPLLQGSEFPELSLAAIERYARFFQGKSLVEPRTAWLVGLLLIPAAIGLFYRAGRNERLLGVMCLILGVLLVVMIPNIRYQYLFYFWPLLFVLAVTGLAKLSRPRVLQFLAIGLIACAVGVYGYETFRTVGLAWEMDRENATSEETLRELITAVGDPAEVTIMGPQEFHACAYDTRFRTFHSLIYTKDLAETLRQLEPEIVILTPRTMEAIIQYMIAPIPDRRGESGQALVAERMDHWTEDGLLRQRPDGSWQYDFQAIRQSVMLNLHIAGFRAVQCSDCVWDRKPVGFFVRPKQPGR